MEIAPGVFSTTVRVWETLKASYEGDLQKLKELVAGQRELIYAQYNYTPPIHFAVREGHAEMVKYLLSEGALNPAYRNAAFRDSLITVAADREYMEISALLEEYNKSPERCKHKGHYSGIAFNLTPLQQEFERAVDKEDIAHVAKMLSSNPEVIEYPHYFWGEGILAMPAKEVDTDLVSLLMEYGAKVPPISKWGRFYYFEKDAGAALLLEKGMHPNHMTWHHVTLLHDMAQSGALYKAGLLIKYGAELNLIEEEYQSTPLGMAARWGQVEMVKFLLAAGANPILSGRHWSTPLAWALKKGHSEIAEHLRNAGATI